MPISQNSVRREGNSEEQTAKYRIQGLPELRTFLDPREEPEAAANPIEDSVNIPYSQLRLRLHELPDKGQPILVAGPSSLAHEVVEWLRKGGRIAAGCEPGDRDLSKSREAFYSAPPLRGEEVRRRSSGGVAPTAKSLIHPGRLWSPNEFLIETVKTLPPGRALDLGCGTGRDAVALATLGWNVTAVDRLPEALERGRALAKLHQVEEKIEWIEADLADSAPLFQGSFNLISSLFYFNREVIQKAIQQLGPGGSLLIEAFTPEHRLRTGKPSLPEVLSEGELARLFPGLTVASCCRFEAMGKDTLRVHLRSDPMLQNPRF